MTETHEEHESGLFKGIFFGVVIGLGLAWFLSTPEGEEFKKKLQEEGGELLEKARDSLDSALKDDFVEGNVK